MWWAMRATLTLWLVVERNNKYVRGKKAVIEAIELLLLLALRESACAAYGETEYEVSVEHDAGELDAAVDEMLQEIRRYAVII